MASKLYITEYNRLQVDSLNRSVMAPLEPNNGEQVVDYSAGEAKNGTPLKADTVVVRLHTDSVCSVLFGYGTPVATTSNGRLAAGQTEYRGVRPNPADGAMPKISAITNT